MSKLYDKKTVAYIQSLLKQGQVIIKSVDSYDTLLPNNRVILGEINVVFQKAPDTVKTPGYLASKFLTEKVTKEYLQDWNELPVKTHLIPDMRKLSKDIENNVPYKTFEYVDESGNKMKALVRHLFEIDEMDADQPECREYYETYTDLLLNNKCYMIVMIVPENSWIYCYDGKLNITKGVVVEQYEMNMTPIPEEQQIQEDSTPLF